MADCPSSGGLELLASYAAPEAVMTRVLIEVEVAAPLVDLRLPRSLERYVVTTADLVRPDEYGVPRRVRARLVRERRPGALVPAATVARAFNVVVYPDVWDRFVVRGRVPLTLDDRLLRLAGAERG